MGKWLTGTDKQAFVKTEPTALPFNVREQLKTLKGVPKEKLKDGVYNLLYTLSDKQVNLFLKRLNMEDAFLQQVYDWINQ